MGRSRRRDSQEQGEGAPEWMVTYSDLVTLLLTFFILLFSMATIDKQKFVEIAQSLRSSFMNSSNGERFDTNKGKDIVPIVTVNNYVAEDSNEVNNEEKSFEEQQKQEKLDNVKEQIEGAIKGLNLGEYVKVVDEDKILILRFDSVLLFDLGSADIKSTGKDILLKLGTLLKQLEHDMLIQGHTDNLPINTSLFPTNWELSTKRATNVVLFLVGNCGLDATKLTATGNGEFKPIVANDTEANRQKNRRIDIVISK